ncbi:hypothetical protein [Holospora curviuscula]|uniref:Uncharacterized protein n=1 Tax=Holospora curviuscula TaxID=1082868 RepID=A0A2S5R8Y6_9PROT|nr:hypothetical protein [Holospora curviuscula]PPE03767.1 hypothetical protein HCUR_00782 [Holospora curviuscula]
MGSTLVAIGLLTGSVEVLTCWVKKMFLPNMLENRGILMDNAGFYQGKAMQKMTKEDSHTLPLALFS